MDKLVINKEKIKSLYIDHLIFQMEIAILLMSIITRYFQSKLQIIIEMQQRKKF